MLYFILLIVLVIICYKVFFSIEKPSKPYSDQIELQRVNFLIIEENDEIPVNSWYRKAKWLNPNRIAYSGKWDKDWKMAEDSVVNVAGISMENRQENFLKVMNANGFYLSLEFERDNPVNRNARKVLAHGYSSIQTETYHIGYLPDAIANKYSEVEIDIRPKSVLLPDGDFENISIELTLLERSAAYYKKQKKATSNN